MRIWVCACGLVCALLGAAAVAQRKPALPKPQRMDAGVTLVRNPSSGELRYRRGAEKASPSDSAVESGALVLRSRVNLVEVNCSVAALDGGDLISLGKEDFRLFQDGVEQKIEHFDAAGETASVALILDASPSVTRDIAEMKSAARALADRLAPADEIAVTAFEQDAYLLLPFSAERELLDRAINNLEILRSSTRPAASNVYQAVYLAAQQLFRGRRGRKAIVLLTDGEDSGLGLGWHNRNLSLSPGQNPNRLQFEDVVRALSKNGVEVYAITPHPRPKAMTEAWLSQRKLVTLINDETREAGIPAYTAYLAELVRLAGGELFFLREAASVQDIYVRIAAHLRTQYTLGFYASAHDSKWHSLRVVVPRQPEARMEYRTAFFAAASWE